MCYAGHQVSCDGVQVVPVGSKVVKVAKQTNVDGIGFRGNAIDHGECVGRGAQRIV